MRRQISPPSDNQPILSREYIVRAIEALGEPEKSFFVQILLHDLTFRGRSISFPMEFDDYASTNLKIGDRVNIRIGKHTLVKAR